MSIELLPEIRQDCLLASDAQPALRARFARRHIAVTGGTGFLGTWIAEMVAALNDCHQLGVTLDLYARNIHDWARNYPHLAGRGDIRLLAQDVRSPFEFSRNTNFIVHAAGIPNNRVHASDPLRVHQTTVLGTNNVLEAATQLDSLVRILNVSSCMVYGTPDRPGALAETDCFAIPSGQLHTVYAEAKRAAESLAAIYRSQFRMPVSMVRPFTFVGPYQELDRPWAINNFFRDVLLGGDIRIHGDGLARRSYLYGSDAAWWTLAALANGCDGQIYNIGSPSAVTHLDLVKLIGEKGAVKPRILTNTASTKQGLLDDLFPDVSSIQKGLGVRMTCPLESAVDKTWRWFANARH